MGEKEGDKVTSGDVIAEIETDKATMEVEAVDEGVIGKILIAEGTEGVKVNTPIAVLLGDGESASDIGSAPAAKAEAPKEEAPKEARRPKTSLLPASLLRRRLKSLPIRIFRLARKWFR